MKRSVQFLWRGSNAILTSSLWHTSSHFSPLLGNVLFQTVQDTPITLELERKQEGTKHHRKKTHYVGNPQKLENDNAKASATHSLHDYWSVLQCRLRANGFEWLHVQCIFSFSPFMCIRIYRELLIRCLWVWCAKRKKEQENTAVVTLFCLVTEAKRATRTSPNFEPVLLL